MNSGRNGKEEMEKRREKMRKTKIMKREKGGF